MVHHSDSHEPLCKKQTGQPLLNGGVQTYSISRISYSMFYQLLSLMCNSALVTNTAIWQNQQQYENSLAPVWFRWQAQVGNEQLQTFYRDCQEPFQCLKYNGIHYWGSFIHTAITLVLCKAICGGLLFRVRLTGDAGFNSKNADLTCRNCVQH